MEKSVKERKGGAENSEAGLDRWCRRRAEAERENKKVESPKQIKNKAEQDEKKKAGVEELKKVIQEMGLQQQMIQGVGDCVEKKIGVEIGKFKTK